MNHNKSYEEHIPPRPPIAQDDVIEWTDSGKRAKIDSGITVPRSQVEFGNHWTETEHRQPLFDPEVVTMIRGIEHLLAVHFAEEVAIEADSGAN